MADFRDNKTNHLEQRCLSLFQAMGFAASRNNLTNILDIDYLIQAANTDLYVDFQYSADFHKYGEIRVDFISAYSCLPIYSNTLLYDLERKIAAEFATNQNKSLTGLQSSIEKCLYVTKYGKVFDMKLSSIAYYIYNKPDKEIKTETIPDIIAVIRRTTLFEFLDRYLADLISARKLKLNDKSELGDMHGSAFIAIPLSALLAFKPCFVLYTNELKRSL